LSIPQLTPPQRAEMVRLLHASTAETGRCIPRVAVKTAVARDGGNYRCNRICDRVADGRLTRANWTGTLGLSGTVSPGDGECSTRHMHFGFKFTSIKLCEIWIGDQEISCVSGRA
jgi:hypothetical protein